MLGRSQRIRGQGQCSECDWGRGSERDRGRGSELDQGRGSECDRGQGSEWEQGQGSEQTRVSAHSVTGVSAQSVTGAGAQSVTGVRVQSGTRGRTQLESVQGPPPHPYCFVSHGAIKGQGGWRQGRPVPLSLGQPPCSRLLLCGCSSVLEPSSL